MADPYPLFTSKKHFTISSNPGIGYQVKLLDPFGSSVITYADGMGTDFSKIRFSDGEDNTLYYYIKSYIESTSAIVIVKLASTSTTVTLNYWDSSDEGYSEVVSESSIENTMEFADEFSGATLDESKWPTAVNTVTYTIDSGLKVTDATKSNATYWITDNTKIGSQLQASWTPLDSFVLEYSLEVSNGTTASMGQIGVGLIGSDNCISASNPVVDANVGQINTALIHGFVETTTETGMSITPASQTRDFRIIKNGSAVTLYHKTPTETSWTQRLTGTTVDVSKIAVVAGAYSTNPFFDYVKVLNVSVQKYIETEPTFSESSAVGPIAAFSADVQSGTSPLTVTFTDTSTGTPTSWLWDFGDGNTSETQSPEHIYAGPGTYKVILTATNEGGSDTETKIDYIEVTPSASTIIVYIKEIEMDHKVGSTAKYPFRIAAANGSGFKSTCTNPVVKCSINGADETTETTWTISSFSATMNRFTIEVTDPGTWQATEKAHILIECDEGTAELFLNIVPDYSLLATASALETVDGKIDTLDTVADGIQTDMTAIKGPTWSADTDTLELILDAAETGGTGSGATAQEVWEYNDRQLTAVPTGSALTTDVMSAVTSIKGTGTETLDTIAADIAGINVTVDGSDLITMDTVITLPSGRTKTFEQILEDIYKYRKY